MNDIAMTELSGLKIRAKPGERKMPFVLPNLTMAERDALDPEFLVNGAFIFVTDE